MDARLQVSTRRHRFRQVGGCPVVDSMSESRRSAIRSPTPQEPSPAKGSGEMAGYCASWRRIQRSHLHVPGKLKIHSPDRPATRIAIARKLAILDPARPERRPRVNHSPYPHFGGAFGCATPVLHRASGWRWHSRHPVGGWTRAAPRTPLDRWPTRERTVPPRGAR